MSEFGWVASVIFLRILQAALTGREERAFRCWEAWLAPLTGALVLLFSGLITPGEFIAGLTSSGEMNPIKILILFLSMTIISVFLDNAGFFRYLAGTALARSKGGQKSLFNML